MAVYIYTTIFALAIIWGLLFKYLNYTARGKALYLALTFIPIALLMMLRSVNIGTDTYNYAVNIYTSLALEPSYTDVIDSYSYSGKFYWLIMYIASAISGDAQMYILVESLIISFGIALFIYRASSDAVLSVVIFLGVHFFSSLSAARQMVSIVLALHGLLYLVADLRSVRGYLLCALGVMVHFVSLVVVIPVAGIYLARRLTPTKLVLGISLGTIIAAKSVESIITTVLTIFMPDYLGYLNLGYGQNILAGDASYGFGILATHLVYLAVILLYLYKIFSGKIEYQNTLAYLLLPTALIAAICGVIFYDNMVFPRLYMMFDFIYLLFIPAVLAYYRGSARFALYGAVAALVSVGYLRQVFLHGFPYEFFF